MLNILALAVLAVSAAAQASFSIITPPALVTCQPARLSWTGGVPPYILSIIPGGQTGAAALQDINNNIDVMAYTWNTNVVGGTYLTFKLVDKNGDIAYSAPLTVQAGSSTDCLQAGASQPPQPSAPAASAPAASGSSAAAGSSGAAASGSSSVKPPAASTTTKAAAALAPVAPVAAVVAVAGAALLF
ncbi:hypothetical protein CcaverHIS002_0603420 [Cutaneotrichosporon cavernicola]|uniref:Ser-Thr-rich glycosyl-phosphatidyl-inositol-anchored membrane family-domain-containing protein n=1 Tax=Cutaneotrichosporon cavernicola TaxID=279322 RepID=A0AA48L8F9_9TREE|nr:uncharacterized protein CcaverHIS019_0602890 [Cutaneotrichosporon cavernicola]BEI86055.1 hypothetical protein CcaverHIS002_0603420 [Cutaneotrichosporon cavernicola]BEI93830.1 hypothetical protein CcaverHIS019_0602890 [Cutaneotrichosporon cavernicola]BEJ01606.1 hypothetical protein CcaverHIS631_0602880 [Cutaneotrichosporon cavernicola]BEJ09374.1 hypothetical protein CcaverHIS641_0602890 [Cutaneotrichosporon cavernicola]